jgi:hypothetical protein
MARLLRPASSVRSASTAPSHFPHLHDDTNAAHLVAALACVFASLLRPHAPALAILLLLASYQATDTTNPLQTMAERRQPPRHALRLRPLAQQARLGQVGGL